MAQDAKSAWTSGSNARDPVNDPHFSRTREFIRSLLLTLLGIGLGFITAECAVRLMGLGRPVFLAYSATRGWKLRAGAKGWQTQEGHAFIRLNRWGYRGDDWTVPIRPKNTLRIAVLGDSFVEAQQVARQDTACEVVQRELARMLPAIARGRFRDVKQVEVMNFGVDGYGTAQEFYTLVEDVWQFAPDIVVLAFFPGNDVRNNSAVLEGDKCRPFFVPLTNQVVLGGPFEDSRLFHFECFLRFESYHSQLLNVLGEARSALRSMQRKRRQHSGRYLVAFQSAAIVSRVDYEPGINDFIYRQPINQDWRDAWSVSEAEIAMTAQNVQAHHALFLLVIIGTGIQVMPDAAFQGGYLRAVGGTDLLYPSHRLVAMAARKRLDVLDLVPPMRIYAQDRGVYFHGFPNTAMGTGHWNQQGNYFAARLIAEKIAAMIERAVPR
jgi:hypothetical protein